MFRTLPTDYRERADIIGNKAFLDFVDELEKLEELKLEAFELGKEKLRIVTIIPLDNRIEYDVGLPLLTASLVRKKTWRRKSLGLKEPRILVLANCQAGHFADKHAAVFFRSCRHRCLVGIGHTQDKSQPETDLSA